MGAGQSASSVSKEQLHQLNLGPNRVPFKPNKNQQGDSDYDDEDDSKVDAADDQGSSSEDEQIKDKGGRVGDMS